MKYSHTQKVPSNVLAMASLAGIAIGLTPPGMLARLALLGTLGAVGATFRSLTVEVDSDSVSLRFGDGLIHKTFPLEEISHAEPFRTSWLMGWGIHWVGNGWLYNVYGLDAVHLIMKKGKHVYIGSDDAENLIQEINSRVPSMV